MGSRRDERKQKRREKYARIRESVHGKTERSLTRFFLWIRLDRIGAKILNWAEGHRRGMFAITIAFLSCVAALCLWVRPKIGPRQVYDSIRTDSIRNPAGRAGMTNPLDDLDLREMFELIEIEGELRRLVEKETLTPADSVRAMEIIEQLDKMGYE